MSDSVLLNEMQWLLKKHGAMFGDPNKTIPEEDYVNRANNSIRHLGNIGTSLRAFRGFYGPGGSQRANLTPAEYQRTLDTLRGLQRDASRNQTLVSLDLAKRQAETEGLRPGLLTRLGRSAGVAFRNALIAPTPRFGRVV